MHSNEDENEETVNTLNLLIVRDELLNNFDSWGAQLTDELKQQPKVFDIIPLIEQNIELLEKINTAISKKIYTAFEQEGHNLVNLMFETQGIKGIPCLINGIGSEEKLNLSIIWFPFEIIAKITGIEINVNYTNESPIKYKRE